MQLAEAIVTAVCSLLKGEVLGKGQPCQEIVCYFVVEVYKELLYAFIFTPKVKESHQILFMSNCSNQVVIHFPKLRQARAHILVVTRISR